jgi:hypothetical protein
MPLTANDTNDRVLRRSCPSRAAPGNDWFWPNHDLRTTEMYALIRLTTSFMR